MQKKISTKRSDNYTKIIKKKKIWISIYWDFLSPENVCLVSKTDLYFVKDLYPDIS